MLRLVYDVTIGAIADLFSGQSIGLRGVFGLCGACARHLWRRGIPRRSCFGGRDLGGVEVLVKFGGIGNGGERWEWRDWK